MIRLKIIISLMLAALFNIGCGSGGSVDSVVTVCTQQSYDKANLPPKPDATSFNTNPLYSQQWAVHYDYTFYRNNGIDSEASVHMDGDHNFLGRSVKVVIIDDALDVAHEDIAGSVAGTYNVRTNTSDVLPDSPELNHGTEVTGIIAALNNNIGLVGVAPGAEIYFVRLPFGNNISISEIVEAFEKAKEWGADVINCSWGSGNVDDAVRAAIVDLATNGRGGKGAVVVFAAGNGGDDAIGDPIGNDESGIPEVLAVGATNIYNERTAYSNYGPQLDLMAPGGEYYGITTTDRSGQDGDSSGDYLEYNSQLAFGGTSAAAPIVSGIAALLLEANPSLTREDVFDAMMCNADKIGPYAYENGRNDYYGYGKVNTNNSLNAVR